LIRADIARVTGDLESGTELALQALKLLPEEEAHARAVARVDLAHGYLATGHVNRSAEREAAEAILPVRRIGNRFATLISTTNLARLQALQGKLHQAVGTFALAEQVISGDGRMQELLNSAAYYFGLGDVLREWNQLEAAQQHLAHGLDLIQGTLSVDADVVTAGYIALAKLKQVQGDLAGSIRVLSEFVQLAGEGKFFAPLIARGAAVQAQILLWQGNLTASVQWMEESEIDYTDVDLSYPREVEYLTLARVMTVKGQTAEAERLLRRLLHLAEAGERKDSTIKILALQALALDAQGEPLQAINVLGHALSLAEPEGYIRTFVDEGDPMRSLISDFRLLIEKQADESISLFPYVDRLLAAFTGATSRALPVRNRANEVRTQLAIEILPESLSDRELAVLRLIADGASNAEIAKTLIIAISTVKRHTGNLYGKLGVNSRTRAIARAQLLGLLN
jgi:LuxR family maltose regulon positive regulatory protein